MKYFKKIIVLFLILGIVFATLFFIKSNKKDITEYKTVKLQKETTDKISGLVQCIGLVK